MSRALIDSIIEDRMAGASPALGPDRLLNCHPDVWRQFLADCLRDGTELTITAEEAPINMDARRVSTEYRGFQVVSYESMLAQYRGQSAYGMIVDEAARLRREREEGMQAVPSNVWWHMPPPAPEPVDPALRRMDGQTAHDVLAREVNRRYENGTDQYQEIRVTRELAAHLVAEMQRTAMLAQAPVEPQPLDNYRGITFMGCPVIWDREEETAEFRFRQAVMQVMASAPPDMIRVDPSITDLLDQRIRAANESMANTLTNALFGAPTPRRGIAAPPPADDDDYEYNMMMSRRRRRRGHQAVTVHEGMAKLELTVTEITARAA